MILFSRQGDDPDDTCALDAVSPRPTRVDWDGQPREDYDLVMPVFALYGSEWFHREWDGGNRSVWHRLMRRIGWSDSEYWELYPAMASGLEWWRHSFIKLMKTHYLETFAYQSGEVLPTGF